MGKFSGFSLRNTRLGRWAGFGRQAAEFAAGGQNAPDLKTGDLFGWASLDDNFRQLTYVQDPDVVLKKIKKTRADLELLLTDPDIKQAVNTRLDALVATPFRLDPSEGELAEFIWENLARFSPRILECAFLARLYGFSVAERVYSHDAQGRIILKDVKPCDLRKFRITPEDRLEIGLNASWEPVNTTSKFLLTRCSPTVTNPYGDSLLTSLYWVWKFKNDSQRFMMQYLERCGIPLIVGKTGRDVRAMAAALKKAYQDAILTIDATDSVEMLGRDGSGELGFTSVDNMFTKKILIMILGQTLTTTTDGSGSRALGEVQDKVRMDKRDSDLRLCLPTVQNVVNALVWLNWEASVEPPLVSYEDNKGLESTRAERDVKFLQSGQVKFTRRYYTDKYDFSDEDIVLKGEDGFNDSDGGPNSGSDASPAGERAGTPEEAAADMQKAADGKMALARTVYRLATERSRFTRDERAIEKAVVELAQATAGEFDPGAVVDAVLSAESGEDLINRLISDVFALSGDKAERPELVELMLDAHIYGELAQ